MEYTVGWGVGIATTLGVQQLGQLAEEINLRLFALLLHAVGRLSADLSSSKLSTTYCVYATSIHAAEYAFKIFTCLYFLLHVFS